MLLAYEGTRYHGWQIQPDAPTVEGTLEQALLRITQQTVKVQGAGRTDSGVHALNYPASFELNTSLPADKLKVALNAVLPDDIAVKHLQSVPPTFHARHSACGKRYRYLIHNRPYPDPFGPQRAWWLRRTLDLVPMHEAAQGLVGTHDFTAFRSIHCSSPHPVKEMREVALRWDPQVPGLLRLEFEANSFLQHMVRILTGTLVDVGLGKLEPAAISRCLESRDRTQSGQTAPPHGLYMLRTRYPEGLVEWPEGVLHP